MLLTFNRFMKIFLIMDFFWLIDLDYFFFLVLPNFLKSHEFFKVIFPCLSITLVTFTLTVCHAIVDMYMAPNEYQMF